MSQVLVHLVCRMRDVPLETGGSQLTLLCGTKVNIHLKTVKTKSSTNGHKTSDKWPQNP